MSQTKTSRRSRRIKLTVAGVLAIELLQAHGNKLVRHGHPPHARWSSPLYRRKLMDSAADRTITTLIRHGIVDVTQERDGLPVRVKLNDNWLLTGKP